MGIAFITAKAEAFRHRRNKEFEEQMNSEKLFSDQEESIVTTYRCRSHGNDIPPVGSVVLLYDAHSAIGVFYLNRRIGVMVASDAKLLLQLMKQSNTETWAATVVEIHPMSKSFLVQLGSQ